MNKYITSLTRNRIITILITLVMIVSVVLGDSAIAYAEPENASIETTETGTQTNAKDRVVDVDEDITEDIESIIPQEWEEIKISSADELIYLARNCSLDTWSRNKYVLLMNDISLYDTDFLTIPTFGGVFDGQGHTISNYNVTSGQTQIGLFANVQKQGVIKNLNVSGRINPSGSQSIVGGIAGDNNGIIMDCSFKGIVESKDYVGGIAGINRLEGIISDCSVEGVIMGTHFTGGIVGENMGNIIRATNNAEVNTTEQESSLSLEELDIDSYLQKFSLNHDDSDTNSESMVKNDDIVDVGGIAGLSIGVIQYCTNNATIGYEKIGYNVGGITGRQSGYIYNCNNKGEVLGRKDVGGITGQAEPYVTVDFTQDIVYQLSENINKLHDIIAVTLNDVDGSSDTVSNRLSIIQQFTNGAIQDTDYLASNTVDWVDGMVGSANEVIGRADYILQETSKQGGVLDQAGEAASHMTTAGSQIASTLGALDVYKYMTPEQQVEYEQSQTALAAINKEYSEYLTNANVAYTNYYLDDIRRSTNYHEKDDTYTNYYTDTTNESDLAAKSGGTPVDPDYAHLGTVPTTKQKNIYNNYKSVDEWYHSSTGNAFPDPNAGAQQDLDKKLQKAVADSSSDIARDAENCANTLYTEKHSSVYSQDVLTYTMKMTNILNSDNVRGQMTDDMKSEVDSTVGYMNNAKDSLSSAVNQSKDIFNNVLSRGTVTLPTLGADYKAHTTSLNNNLQGMSDNFGYLNQELNGSTDTLVADLSAVNDQFNVIMNLYTDAIDGVLDKDYSNTIEDNSLEVAEVCTDATIADCKNTGKVSGALDVSGIAGTMAIEYDYDLESDVTGIKDANLNTTYLTKCVLRNNTNRGLVKAEKSYSAGICGLQEMGTILKCSNYEKITSVSGEYVGGIAGSSLSDIVQCYSKGILDGKSYVGGIAGKVNNATGCYAWVDIKNAVDYYGAIAGEVTTEGRIRKNYFLSEDLAGINRISYSLKAEPISKEELSEVADLPQSFGQIRIVFVLDDGDSDEKSIIGEDYISYGSLLDPAKYPVISPKEGYYVVWDDTEEQVFVDTEIIASYERNLTTLASDVIRDNKQSAILVDGRFQTGEKFDAYLSKISVDRMDNTIEYWELEIPEDDNYIHQIRYVLPDDVQEEIDQIGVYYLSGDNWVRADDVSTMGNYYTFNVPGRSVRVQIVDETEATDIKIIILIVVAGTVGILLIVLLITFAKKGKANKKKSVKDKSKESK